LHSRSAFPYLQDNANSAALLFQVVQRVRGFKDRAKDVIDNFKIND